MKKFIFSKFAGLQTYSWQLYYQMNSFTGIFWQYFKPPPSCFPHLLTLGPPPPRIKFWKAPPPPNGHLKSPQWHVLNTCWKPCIYTHIYTNKKYLYLRFQDFSLKLTPPSPNLLALRDNCLNDPTLSLSILGPELELLAVTCFRGDLLRGVLVFSLS